MKTAIDVVLLLPSGIADQAIGMSRALYDRHSGEIILDRTTCVPHISLCMGVIGGEALRDVQSALASICYQFAPLRLTTGSVSSNTLPNGATITGWDIEPQARLQQLHNFVVTHLRPYLKPVAEPEAFVRPPEINDLTRTWVEQYAQLKADGTLAQFRPHITLGLGDLETQNIPVEFQVTEIAVYQLGNYCTCRKQLLEFRLGANRVKPAYPA